MDTRDPYLHLETGRRWAFPRNLAPALRRCDIAGAALDHFHEEPLGPDSPYWDLDNVIVTPHNASETRMYEENLMDILIENLGRLGRGETELLHQVV